MKAVRRAIAIVAIVTAFVVPMLEATPAGAATPGDFVSRINSLRASKGLGALSIDGGLSSVAQGWAEKMASVNTISHNPGLGSSVSGGWTKLGENVGTGGDVDAIFNALVASPGHYRNMVDDSFNRIGVGIAVGSDGRIYTAHDFGAFPGGASAAPAKSAPVKAASTATTAKPAAAASKPAGPKPAAKAASPKTTTPAQTPTTEAAAPAQPTAPVAEAPAPPPAPAPLPSGRIVQGLTEVGSISTQG